MTIAVAERKLIIFPHRFDEAIITTLIIIICNNKLIEACGVMQPQEEDEVEMEEEEDSSIGRYLKVEGVML